MLFSSGGTGFVRAATPLNSALTSQSGAAMNVLTITRLGKVNAGEETAAKGMFKGHEKDEDPDTKVTRINIPAPVVLWNRDTWAGALYLHVETCVATGMWRQEIDYLLPPVKGLAGRMKAMVEAYPIRFHAKGLYEEKDLSAVNSIGDIYTGDVNGDGADELVVTRNFGGIEVYDRERQIWKYTPSSSHSQYKFKMEDVNFTTLGDHDEIFFTAHREPLAGREGALDEKDWVVRVSPVGIQEIHPVFPDNREPGTIKSVIGLNRPGSKTVDELILVCTLSGKNGVYVSRHDLSGRAIGAPREIYTDYSMYFKAFGYAGTNQIIARNNQDRILYFITPDKPVNWIKTVKFDTVFGEKSDVNIIGHTQRDNQSVLVMENRGKVYAMNALGKFYTSMKPGSGTSDQALPFLTLKPESQYHKIIDVTPADKTMESFLVIQSREPAKRELSLEELEKAGERFLSDYDWNYCKKRLRLKYDESNREFVEFYCKQHKIQMPDIHSLEDIKQQLPGYYEEKVKESQRRYRSALEIRLFNPLEMENTDNKGSIDDEENDYKNKGEYKKWLAGIFIAPELVFRIHHLKDGVVTVKKLGDYYFKAMDTYGLAQPDINCRASDDHGMVFMVLHRKTLEKDFQPAYYTIAW
jgi:hypothetical protein